MPIQGLSCSFLPCLEGRLRGGSSVLCGRQSVVMGMWGGAAVWEAESQGEGEHHPRVSWRREGLQGETTRALRVLSDRHRVETKLLGEGQEVRIALKGLAPGDGGLGRLTNPTD